MRKGEERDGRVKVRREVYNSLTYTLAPTTPKQTYSDISELELSGNIVFVGGL